MVLSKHHSFYAPWLLEGQRHCLLSRAAHVTLLSLQSGWGSHLAFRLFERVWSWTNSKACLWLCSPFHFPAIKSESHQGIQSWKSPSRSLTLQFHFVFACLTALPPHSESVFLIIFRVLGLCFYQSCGSGRAQNFSWLQWHRWARGPKSPVGGSSRTFIQYSWEKSPLFSCQKNESLECWRPPYIRNLLQGEQHRGKQSWRMEKRNQA